MLTEENLDIVDETPEVAGWSDQELRTAVTMWENKASAAEIAALVHKTRNAVIGKMNRMGRKWGSAVVVETEALADTPAPETPPEAPPEPAPEMPTPVHQPEVPTPVHTPEPAPMPVVADAPTTKGVPFLHAKPFTCRFPLFKGHEPIEQKFVCGEPIKGITSWCKFHHDVVFEPARPRKR